MLGLHNILFIAPPPSFHHHQPPHIPSTHQIANTNDQCNIANNQESWTTLNKYQQKSSFLKRGDLNVVGDNDTGRDIGPARACRDCGNRAKKECQYRRCRTCCKSREYDCTTHMKSTWVSAARRRERHGCGGVGGGDSSASSGGGCVGGKRPRENVTTTSNSFSTSNNNAAASVNFDTGSSYQDASFKLSLPGQVREPAVFRCIRVTAINSGEAEVAYQAKVNISGHVFKGILYDQGIDEKNLFPCVPKMQSGERTRDSTSPILEPSVAYAATGNHRLLEEKWQKRKQEKIH
ncbi:protein LATERAL ROOT PRIMORDIUM 1-like [Populus alba x Populus x berolinensis]|uniref:Protein LATERAL ROOT PRIMORDIUM 1-like n=1 Tax=Populus alba x Populus x berolinensis TaxID=444605 RepID=A0AAD6RIK5_9ROSI|nr:protein LATERAL ROOT PRIMORDIUM 1-like [Populus alba x Populus x berolinensis]